VTWIRGRWWARPPGVAAVAVLARPGSPVPGRRPCCRRPVRVLVASADDAAVAHGLRDEGGATRNPVPRAPRSSGSKSAMREHAADLEPADLGALGLEAGRALPSESTIRRVLKDLDPAGLDARAGLLVLHPHRRHRRPQGDRRGG